MATLEELRTAVTTLRNNCKEHNGFCSKCMFKIGGDCTLTYTPEYWEDPAPRIAFTDADKAAAKMCKELGYKTIVVGCKSSARRISAVSWNPEKPELVLPPELFKNFDTDIALPVKTIVENDYMPIEYMGILKQPAHE